MPLVHSIGLLESSDTWQCLLCIKMYRLVQWVIIIITVKHEKIGYVIDYDLVLFTVLKRYE